MTRQIRVGLSGWMYKGWRGRFYPRGLAHRLELAYAAGRYGAIEINGTFYSLQRPESFRRWHDQTPDDFRFAIKGPRFITHMLKLRNVRTPLANFLASGVLALEKKLGPILWQFPAAMPYDEARFEDFIRQLRRHRIALVVADTVDWPLLMDVTADFMYCRLHGSEQLYVSGYGEADLKRWAARARAWARGGEPRDAVRVLPRPAARPRGRDVFVFFDNDAKVRAPPDAAGLQALLKCGPRQSP